jgi:hypothetical protein
MVFRFFSHLEDYSYWDIVVEIAWVSIAE